MKIKYFEYNNDPNGEKYIEVSEEKFIKDVMITEGRFYISFGNFVLECREKEYRCGLTRKMSKIDTQNDKNKRRILR